MNYSRESGSSSPEFYGFNEDESEPIYCRDDTHQKPNVLPILTSSNKMKSFKNRRATISGLAEPKLHRTKLRSLSTCDAQKYSAVPIRRSERIKALMIKTFNTNNELKQKTEKSIELRRSQRIKERLSVQLLEPCSRPEQNEPSPLPKKEEDDLSQTIKLNEEAAKIYREISDELKKLLKPPKKLKIL